jgi:Ni/Co efflux regulator RcnB
MKTILSAGLALSLLLGASAASAQDRHDDRHDDHRGPPPGAQHFDHHGWRKGGRVDRDEWRQGHRVDYRARHLRRPPRGYEWREVNGDYVLGAIATGVIADLLLNNH